MKAGGEWRKLPFKTTEDQKESMSSLEAMAAAKDVITELKVCYQDC